VGGAQRRPRNSYNQASLFYQKFLKKSNARRPLGGGQENSSARRQKLFFPQTLFNFYSLTVRRNK